MSANTSLEVYEYKRFYTYHCFTDRSQYRDDARNYQYGLLFLLFLFFSQSLPIYSRWGSIVAFFIAYGLYKFALKYIYDEWGHYR
jgi:hypothetical protein